MMAGSCGTRQLDEVVSGADQSPFGLHFVNAAQQELPEPSCLFDVSEHGFDDVLAQSVATSARLSLVLILAISEPGLEAFFAVADLAPCFCLPVAM